jgi:hypothetical protein
VSIWVRPRATIQQLVDTDPERYVVALAALSGIVQMLGNASDRNLGDRVGLPVVLTMALLLGPFVGLIGVYLWALLLKWTGRWIGGHASAVQLRAAIAWAGVPIIVGGVAFVGALLIAGKELFTEATPWLDQNPGWALLTYGLLITQFVTVAWGIVVSLKTVGQVQGFSAWRALGNTLLPLLLVVVLGIVTAIVIPMLVG